MTDKKTPATDRSAARLPRTRLVRLGLLVIAVAGLVGILLVSGSPSMKEGASKGGMIMDAATTQFAKIAAASCAKANAEGFTESAQTPDNKTVTLILVPSADAVDGYAAAATSGDQYQALNSTDWFSACAADGFFKMNASMKGDTQIKGAAAVKNADGTWTMTVPGTPDAWVETFRVADGLITSVKIKRDSGDIWSSATYGANPQAKGILTKAAAAAKAAAASASATPTPAPTK